MHWQQSGAPPLTEIERENPTHNRHPSPTHTGGSTDYGEGVEGAGAIQTLGSLECPKMVPQTGVCFYISENIYNKAL
jgi:hypothetical protein